MINRIKPLLWFAFSILIVSGAMAKPVKFIAFGDAPYFLPEAESMFKKLRTQVESRQPSFAVHVGDLGVAQVVCTEKGLKRVHTLLNQFELPVFYTPGDNDWTDCHRLGTQEASPKIRLSEVRRLFFAKSISLGTFPRPYISQALSRRDKRFPENAMWSENDIVFATIHIVGSNNGLDPLKSEAQAEYKERNKANLQWLETVFKEANSRPSKTLVLFFHAELNYGKKHGKKSGFRDTLNKLVELVKGSEIKVLAVHGDSHRFTVDHPLVTKNKWDFEHPLENFTRLEVYGHPDVRAIEVIVNPEAKQPFTISPLPNIEWEYQEP